MGLLVRVSMAGEGVWIWANLFNFFKTRIEGGESGSSGEIKLPTKHSKWIRGGERLSRDRNSRPA